MARRIAGDWRLVAVLAAMAALLSFAWLSLERTPVGIVELGRVLGLALVPAAVALLTGRRLAGLAVAGLAALPGVAYAFGIPLSHMRPGDADFFGPLFAAISDGFSDFYATRVPFDRPEHVEMHGAVLAALFVFLAVAGLAAVARRSLLAAAVVVVGVGWPATVAATIPGASPLWVGGVLLGAVLVVLLLTGDARRPARRLAPALVVGGLLVVAALGASTSGAVAKGAFLTWQRWNYHPKPTTVGVRYVWASNYSGITFPEKPTVVLRIKAPNRALYWRATTLDEYTGVGWRETLSRVGEPRLTSTVRNALDDGSLPPQARLRRNWTRQDVEVTALADTHLVGAAAPVRWESSNPERLQYTSGGVVLIPDGLEPGDRYTVWSYVPAPDPNALGELPADYPDSMSRYLELIPDVELPAFAAEGRGSTLDALFAGTTDDLLAEYEPVYRRARQIAGDARSPYVVAATLELWFRSTGGFRYEEQPEQPVDSTPPLVDFVLRTKEGYCQQYAGSMALMLRLLGIPARVAAGFTSGTYDSSRGEWVVNDTNAHTWVEVWFPTFGWLPFDPTPGRGQLTATYSTSSNQFTTEGLKQLQGLGLGLSPTLEQLRQAQLQGRAEAGDQASGASAGAGSAAGGGGLGPALLTALVVAGLLAGWLGLKALRRDLRFRRRDGRGIATACRRDLAAFLADQRLALPPTLTLDQVGSVVERRFRVDAKPFVAAVAAARFGPADRVEDAARGARGELRALQRDIRRQLPLRRRLLGALSVRSLPL